MRNNAESLGAVATEIENCTWCKKDTTGEAVPGEGDPHAQVMFIGEAPGKQEALTGRPFVGRSGKLLREQIIRIGLLEKDVFITSVVKYLPLRGTPSKEQIAHGRIHLKTQIALIKPKVVVLLGSVAAEGVLEAFVPIAKEHGEIKKRNNTVIFLSYHPAAAIRFQKLRKIFVSDFDKLKELLVKQKIL